MAPPPSMPQPVAHAVVPTPCRAASAFSCSALPSATVQSATADVGDVVVVEKTDKAAENESSAASDHGGAVGSPGGAIDFTCIPATLDAKFDALDTDAAMRATTIKVGTVWRKSEKPTLLGQAKATTLLTEEQSREKRRAFGLLDAVTRAGALPIDAASLHVVLAATHCFDESLMSTLIEKNVNPIEKLERSSLIIAEVVHAAPAARLIKSSVYDRVATYSAPALLPPQEAVGS